MLTTPALSRPREVSLVLLRSSRREKAERGGSIITVNSAVKLARGQRGSLGSFSLVSGKVAKVDI